MQVDLNDVNKIDIAIDGVDEVDLNKNLLKVEGIFLCIISVKIPFRADLLDFDFFREEEQHIQCKR